MTHEMNDNHGRCGVCKHWEQYARKNLGECLRLAEWETDWPEGVRTPYDFWCRDFSARDDAAASAPPSPTTAVSAAAPAWHDIATAPKDRQILIYKPGWRYAVVAEWSEMDGDDGTFHGWEFADSLLCIGIDEGFLGWSDDIDDGNMPTLWAEIPGDRDTQPDIP